MPETTVHHELRGNPDGPTLLLVHGFLSSTTQWDLNIDRLGRDHRLVLIDLPGHGASPAPDDPASYGLDAVIPAIHELRQQVGVDRWWVCGQSLGAAIACNYVLEHPGDVDGFVFTNSRAVFGAGRAQPEVDYRTVAYHDIPFHPANARRFPEAIKARMVERADAIPPHVLNHVIAHRTSWHVADRLAELTMPTLLVNGRFERAFQPFVDQVRHTAPAIEIVHLDGGHSINVEQAAAFDDAVIGFIARHR